MIYLLWTFIASQAHAGPCWHQLDQPGYDIIVVAGQSNAIGYGQGIQADPEATRGDNSQRILQLDRGGRIKSAREPLDHWDNTDNPDFNRSGFAMPFARRYTKEFLYPRRSVLIVPAARGGTSILEWGSRESHVPGQQTFYFDDLHARLKPLLRNKDNRVIAILWHQGETNLQALSAPKRPIDFLTAALVPTVSGYTRLLKNVFTEFRKITSPGVPILAGEIPRPWMPGGPNDKVLKRDFREQMNDLMGTEQCGAFVRSNGLDVNRPGDVHFSSIAQLELGRRYFKAFQKLASVP